MREVRVGSNKGIADCCISLPMRHITGQGGVKGEGEEGKDGWCKARSSWRGISHPQGAPWDAQLWIWGGFDPPPAELGPNPTRRAEQAPKIHLSNSSGTHSRHCQHPRPHSPSPLFKYLSHFPFFLLALFPG